MAKKYQAPRGTYDAIPSEVEKWKFVENTFTKVAWKFGYSEIRTPTFEDTDLFVRSSGDTSEVVSKQMYSFVDKGDRNITLRPELTAPVMRAYLEHSLGQPGQITRLCYCGPIFRYERPQKGRCREAHQVGVELIGSSSPFADAEVIELTVEFYKDLGLPSVEVLINCIGRGATRERFSSALLSYVSGWLKDQSSEDQDKANKNPLRLLDTKDEDLKALLQGAPSINDFLEDASKVHFEAVQARLTEIAVPFRVLEDIVRGLDYYTDTVFEVHGIGLGAQSALCGGGRYDGLIKELGGPDTPSVGVAMGIERAIIAINEAGISFPSDRLDVFVVSDSEDTWKRAVMFVRTLRDLGISAQCSLEPERMDRQMKKADRSGAHIALIIGERERTERYLTAKNMLTGKEDRINLDDNLIQSIVDFLKDRKHLESQISGIRGEGNIDLQRAFREQSLWTIEQILG